MKKSILVMSVLCYLLNTQFAHAVDSQNPNQTHSPNNQDYQVFEVQYNKNETYYVRHVGTGDKLSPVVYPWQVQSGGGQQYQNSNYQSYLQGQQNGQIVADNSEPQNNNVKF